MVNKRYMYWYFFSTSDYDNGKSVITTDHLLSIWIKKKSSFGEYWNCVWTLWKDNGFCGGLNSQICNKTWLQHYKLIIWLLPIQFILVVFSMITQISKIEVLKADRNSFIYSSIWLPYKVTIGSLD